jgi:hypothetical protein
VPVTLTTPNILQDPGYVMWAPLGTAEPTNTVVGSKFTDNWPAGWVSVGMTAEGSTFSYQINVEAINVAESFDPIKYATTSRAGSMAFNMANWALTNWKIACNGGAVTVVSGTTTTQLNKWEAPDPGSEVRAMLGWESTDGTARVVIRQCLNGVEVQSQFQKAPSFAVIPCQFQFEVPTTGKPFTIYTAGSVARI